MNEANLIALVDRLRAEASEAEWLEFKENNHEPHLIGEYLSALANSASLCARTHGYLVYGVQDVTHKVVGTKFKPRSAKGKGNQDLLLWLSNLLSPNLGFEVFEIPHPEGRVVMFEVRAAFDRPVAFNGKPYVRVGTCKTELDKHPEKMRALWVGRTDWSAQPCPRATLSDLDPAAIIKAREQFKIKHARQAPDVDGWDDVTFLNKAKITVQGVVTNTAVLLLGKPESAPLLSPAVAKISWILKDAANREQDYEHFSTPFLLQIDPVLNRIRNLTLRTLPSGTLFPQELSQYDPWVLREALNNCIAHQDYGLSGRIIIVETPTNLLLSNVGSFLPGDVERVIRQDSPSEIYRNPFLADAMVNLNMIDTQGGGIKRMYQAQFRRYFPLPDYDLSEPDRVKVTIQGTILDEHYSQILMERTDLDLWQAVLLDKVQKRQRITPEAHRDLRTTGLVEGRYPNLYISASVARMTDQVAGHIRARGLDKKYYLDLIVAMVREHGPVSRADVDRLLFDKLPEILDERQKKAKVHNLISELSSAKKIVNVGTRGKPSWRVPL